MENDSGLVAAEKWLKRVEGNMKKELPRGFITQKVLRMMDFPTCMQGSTIPGYDFEDFRRFLITVKRSSRKGTIEAKLLPFVRDLVFEHLTPAREAQCEKKIKDARVKIFRMAAAGVPIEAGKFTIVRSKFSDHMTVFEGFDEDDKKEWEALPSVVAQKPRPRS